MFAPLQSSRVTGRPCRRSRLHRAARQAAFTLIELLVVISIIAILVGLLLPAVQAVRRGVYETAVAADIAQMDASMHRFKDDYGFYPSDFTEFLDLAGLPLDIDDPMVTPGFVGITVRERLQQMLAKISPTHNENAAEPVEVLTAISPRTRLHYWWDQVGKKLAHNDINTSGLSQHDTIFHRTRGPQVALWYWLTQLHNDAQYPLTGARDITTPTSLLKANTITSERKVFYDFPAGSLEQLAEATYPTRDGSASYGVYRPLQREGDAPFVYFHNATYDTAGIDFDYDQNYDPGTDDSPNFAAAMIVKQDPLTGEFNNPGKFQIFTAGYSESFGNYNLNLHTPLIPDDIERIEDEDYNECLDNLANFAEGRVDNFLDSQN